MAPAKERRGQPATMEGTPAAGVRDWEPQAITLKE